MLRTAAIVAVSLFISSFCIAPFAMAEPTEKDVLDCNKAAHKMHDAADRKLFLDECIAMPHTETQVKNACDKAAHKMHDAEERREFLKECLAMPRTN